MSGSSSHEDIATMLLLSDQVEQTDHALAIRQDQKLAHELAFRATAQAVRVLQLGGAFGTPSPAESLLGYAQRTYDTLYMAWLGRLSGATPLPSSQTGLPPVLLASPTSAHAQNYR